MTTRKIERWSTPAGLLAIALLAIALPTAQASETGYPEVSATLNFSDSSTASMTLNDESFAIDTIAGRIRINTGDITAAKFPVQTSTAVLSLRNGERWTVDADALVIALLGRESARSLSSRRQVLRSIFINAHTPHPEVNSHSYKVLLKDDSIALIDPATVSLPAEMESGKVEIPLGAVHAVKFAIPEGQTIPDTIFVRLSSGHVYQLAWKGRGRDFSVVNLTGNKLRIAYTDILGLLPTTSFIAKDAVDAPNSRIRLRFKDDTETTGPAPLQIWSFKTPFGNVSLPSTFVSSFTIPEGWREQGKVYTIFGEWFEGRPDFRSLLHDQDGKTQHISLKSLLQVKSAVDQEPRPLPSTAAVFYLAGGFRLAGFPYTPGSLIETQVGKAILPAVNSSITRTKGNLLVYSPLQGGPVISRPTSTSINFALASTGQKVELDWQQIEKIEFNRPIRTSETDLAGAVSLPLGAELPATEPDTPVESAGTDPGSAADAPAADSTSASGFRWLRSRPDVATENSEPPVPVSLKMPWGKMELHTNQIATIYLLDGDDHAILTTTSGDVIVTRAAAIQKSGLPTVSTPMVRLPTTAQRRGTAVRVRLMTGDIITGAFVDDRLPFASTDKSDKREHLPVETITRIMRTGNQLFLYETDRGSINGNPTRDKVAFKPASSDTAVEIRMRDIESVAIGDVPLPPPITHSADRPPALCGLIYLPGGSFTQGSGDTGMTDETPRITVSLSPFLLDATEVTRAQFEAFVADTRYETTAEQAGATTTWMNPGFLQKPDDPVVCVSWTDAAQFCNWRSRKSSLQPTYKINRDGSITTDRAANGYRLPTESEWEFAAGGMRSTAYPWGNAFATADTAKPLANGMQRDGEKDDGWRWTNPVHAFPPDPNGIYGMAGNVWEWCEDWYFDRAYDALKNRSQRNPCIQQADVPGLTHRVMRGGSYRNTSDLLRTASRGSGLPLAYAPHVGFRCARNAN
jgi:formylglycine-generating enzyme required for sulfatase activity